MGNFGFWLGAGAAQKAARVPATNRRHHVISVIVGIVLAVTLVVGLFILLALN
jgi:O-antigen/teichoic acid export membrane protein